MSAKLKIGYLPLTKGSWMNPTLEEKRKNALNVMKGLSPDWAVVGGEKMIAFEPEALEMLERFAEERVDVIVCQFMTFSLGTIVPLIANRLKVPVVLWSMPEPSANGGRLQANSFCAANMNSHFMWKLRIPYFHVHAPTESAEAASQLASFFRSIQAAKVVRILRLGVIGTRVPGFYTSSCDEMMLRDKLGVELKYILLLEVVKTAEALSDAEIAPALALIRAESRKIDGPSEAELKKSAALYTAVQKMKTKFGVETFAMRCWPDVNMNELYGIGVCSTIGTLTNNDTVTACEGDVYGAVLMRIQRELTGSAPFFCDLIVCEGDYGIAWHCGAAPCKLCKENYVSRLRKSSIIDGGDVKGLTNEFPLRTGRVTLARLGEVRDGTGFRMLIATGDGIDTDLCVRGNPLKIRFDAGCDKLREVVIGQGFEHHFSLAYGDISRELQHFCKLMNIEPVVVS